MTQSRQSGQIALFGPSYKYFLGEGSRANTLPAATCRQSDVEAAGRKGVERRHSEHPRPGPGCGLLDRLWEV